MRYYPTFLNLVGKRVLLFGGGVVALRKAQALSGAKARVTAISKDFSEAFLRFAKRNGIKTEWGSHLPRSWRTFSLVIAATSDPEFNRKIYRCAERANIFVNVVDDPKNSTFIVPSSLKRGSLQIAVSTGGASPLLAKLIRKKLSRQFGGKYSHLVTWLRKERKKAKRLIAEQKEHQSHLQKLIETRLRSLEKEALRK